MITIIGLFLSPAADISFAADPVFPKLCILSPLPREKLVLITGPDFFANLSDVPYLKS